MSDDEEAEVNVLRDADENEDLEAQPERRSRCPACGSEPTEASLREHRLSNLGYLHDDQHFECSNCENTYTHGVPVGESDMNVDDLWCSVCDLGYMNVHRAEFERSGLMKLHMKCAHHHEFDCPECDEEILADGVRMTPDHEYTCPHCEEELERDEIPYCHFFTSTVRKTGPQNRALVGYPMMTGKTKGAHAHGYPEEEENE